jgi:type IV pilus assembly protein PilX
MKTIASLFGGPKKMLVHQGGISLPIVLIFLVVLSVLGVTIIQGSTFGARIARNESDRTLAFQAAEAALRDAEADIRYMRANGAACLEGGTNNCRLGPINRSDFDAACTNGLCIPSTTSSNIWETSSLWDASGASVVYGRYTGAAALPIVARQPRYLIEHFKLFQASVVRVTAVGFGANESTKTMLQTSVKVLQ